jgi:hypothetical protein
VIRASRRTNRRGQALILLLAAFLCGSGLIGVGVFATGKSIDDIGVRVGSAVADKNRCKSAENVLDAWKLESETFLAESAKRRDKLVTTLERHDARPEELRAIFDEMRAANQKLQREVLSRRFELQAILTREEWERVFPR